MLSMRSIGSKKWIFLAGMLICAVVCYVFLLGNLEKIVWDAENYYRISQTFVTADGRFSLDNFTGYMRGVSFPLVIFVYDMFSKLTGLDIRYVLLTVNFIMFFVCAVLFYGRFYPNSFFDKSTGRLYVGIALLLIISTILARFIFTTFLSDFPSFILCMLGILLCLRATDSPLSAKTVLAALFSGVALYNAYNFRTIYMFSVLITLCFFAVRILRSKKKWQMLLIALIFILGMGLAAIPQMVVNHARFSSISPMVIMEANGERVSLFTSQLYAGLGTCRYDTYVGEAIKGVDAAYSFHWAPYDLFMQNYTGERKYELALLVLDHPLTYVALYINHFLNMLSPYFTRVYVEDLFEVKWPYLFSMFTVCYFVVWDIMAKIRSREYNFRGVLERRCLPVLAIMAPGLAIVPGQVEYRFGMPLFWLLFTYFVFQCSWKQRIDDIKKEPLRFAICFIGLLGVMLVFWSETLACGAIPLGL